MDMFHSHQQRRATNSLQDRVLLVRPIPTASRFTWVTHFWKEVSEHLVTSQHSTFWCPGTAGSTASQDKRIVRRQVDVVIIKSHSTIQLSTTDSVALSPTGLCNFT
ncbi:uncharacterized protein PGTG_13415 [Puccinia graminis f. sp. tritici CRL 75-36-700-3]|uniref:Uncharacterized protein n=1 Tax=Puccinia graminis f. sp. tritici (strain CRL 75-36-700-3 / race SCCL) TaxID=418459 RepID=E3KTN2_PUCGT|nr:uncharacterized protein PGTG_13415 [Puccinia graminis f. sp. tritici CRL 75-36-700-3]EFP87629.2 hypothetical protein PGTG_13415 [Puccinia graminis f. sp. tritici CRL 75-36-700-3]